MRVVQVFAVFLLNVKVHFRGVGERAPEVLKDVGVEIADEALFVGKVVNKVGAAAEVEADFSFGDGFIHR